MKELIVKVDDSGVYNIEGELIRCEDCKHGEIVEHVDGIIKSMYCHDRRMYTLCKWCSRAERKEKCT